MNGEVFFRMFAGVLFFSALAQSGPLANSSIGARKAKHC